MNTNFEEKKYRLSLFSTSFLLAWFCSLKFEIVKFSTPRLKNLFEIWINQRSIELFKYQYQPEIFTTVQASPPNRAILKPSNQNYTYIIIFASNNTQDLGYTVPQKAGHIVIYLTKLAHIDQLTSLLSHIITNRSKNPHTPILKILYGYPNNSDQNQPLQTKYYTYGIKK